MQLMPATARQYGVRDPHDPYESLRAGARHLRNLLVEFEGSVPLALAAYNAGSGAVKRYGGVPRYRETQDYVRKVTSRLAPGIRKPTPKPEPRAATEDLTLERNTDGSLKISN
jgi:soluble lytic murein transglycosylase-like protein